ncbi:MAG TPA: hypothetical protein VMT52_13505, partial [Planctomycetota bacterium]|nr:hypothetical protein [Planctomycetota bacterium]
MTNPVLDPNVRAFAKDPSKSKAFRKATPSGPGQSPGGGPIDPEFANALEARVLQAVDSKLEDLKKRMADKFVEILGERIEPLVDAKVKKAMNGTITGAAGPAGNSKEAFMKVIQSALFDSGLMEKMIQKAVDSKVKGSGGAVAGATPDLKGEVQAMIQKEIGLLLSSEGMKSMIDEKFRAV